MKKIVCFDLDGVAVAEHAKFSDRLVERQGDVIQSAVDEYFSKHFGAVMIGQSSLGETIEPYLSRFNWAGNTQSLLDFWFNGEKEAIQAVLNLARSIRDSGTTTYVVTDNPAERTDSLWVELLKDYFSGKYVSGETGLKKSNPELWETIASDTGASPESIFFTDDDPENIVIAKSVGVYARLFVSTSQLKADTEQFLVDI